MTEAAARFAMDGVGDSLLQYLNDLTDGPEVLWSAALAIVRSVAADGEEARWSRFRHYPQGQVRHLREGLDRALELAELAAQWQEQIDRRDADLTAELREAAAEAGRKRRRAQTLPAERARLANARARREAR